MKDNEFKSIDQLEAEIEEVRKKYESLQKSLTQKKTEEDERKKAELASVKEKRKKEIEEAKKHYCTLVEQYIKDYGSYSATRSYDNKDDDNFNFLFGSKPWRFFI